MYQSTQNFSMMSGALFPDKEQLELPPWRLQQGFPEPPERLEYTREYTNSPCSFGSDWYFQLELSTVFAEMTELLMPSSDQL